MDLEPDMVHRKSLPQFRMVLITRSLTSVWLFRAKTEEQNKVGNRRVLTDRKEELLRPPLKTLPVLKHEATSRRVLDV